MEEIEEIIKEYELECTVKEFTENKKFQFQDDVRWEAISESQKLSEAFIEKFKDKVDWDSISINQKLSEAFIEKHQDKVDWDSISRYQKLSEKFIEKHQDKVDWYFISVYQKLSEAFIEKHQDKVVWNFISANQKLSETFIEKHQDKVKWYSISRNQKLSEAFIEKFQDKVDVKLQNKKHKEKSYKQKLKEAKAYAKKHNLKIDDEYIYAYRNHDQWGRGMYNQTISYEKGKYYKDWHCDMDDEEENSFGLGIWPKGNTAVKVKIEDWGVAVADNKGKARVLGFEII